MNIRMTSVCGDGARRIEFEGDIEANGGADAEMLKANLDGYDKTGFLAELTHWGVVQIAGCVGIHYEIERTDLIACARCQAPTLPDRIEGGTCPKC